MKLTKEIRNAGLLEATTGKKNAVAVVCTGCGEETKKVKRHFVPSPLTSGYPMPPRPEAGKKRARRRFNPPVDLRSGFKRLCPDCYDKAAR